MGQACCGRMLRHLRRSRRQYRLNKAYEFAPKRSWKYKDASLLSAEEFEEDSEGVLGSGLALGPLNTVHHHQDLAQADSLEEGTDSGPSQIRRSGMLAFKEEDSSSNSDEEGDGVVVTPISSEHHQAEEEEEVRLRTASNASQQIGRFEVMMVAEVGGVALVTGAPQETSKLLTSHVSDDNGQGRSNSISDGQQIS